MELHTNENSTDIDQAYAAGYLEGLLTWNLIAMQWRNSMPTYCQGEEECQKWKDFFIENRQYIEKNIAEKSATVPYWHQVNLLIRQISGIQAGYNKKAEQMNDGTEVDIAMLNLMYELSIYAKVLNTTRIPSALDHCSAIIKPLADGSDLFVAHNMWMSLDAMLRVMKKYDFNYHLSTDSKEYVPGRQVAMSSYPG